MWLGRKTNTIYIEIINVFLFYESFILIKIDAANEDEKFRIEWLLSIILDYF
jgi:hypothetical protein